MTTPSSRPQTASQRRAAETLLTRLWFGSDPLARAGSWLVAPLAWLTAWESGRRRRQIQALPAPPCPVIVVGNLVVGGAGKTPLTLAIADALGKRGHRVGLLCSGYRGRRQDARLVPPDGDAREHGDEAVLLARSAKAPVAAARQRGEALALLLRMYPDLTVVVSDDGLQHTTLPRSVEIAVFDRRGVGSGRLLPAGPLRESLGALDQIDAIALNEPASSPVVHPRIFGFRMVARRFVSLTGEAEPVEAARFADWVGTRTITAVAGIGEPQRFFDMLATLGLKADTLALTDHDPIDQKLLSALQTDLILMTSKDAVKCSEFADRRCWALEVSAEPDPKMIDWLTEVLVGLTPA